MLFNINLFQGMTTNNSSSEDMEEIKMDKFLVEFGSNVVTFFMLAVITNLMTALTKNPSYIAATLVAVLMTIIVSTLTKSFLMEKKN